MPDKISWNGRCVFPVAVLVRSRSKHIRQHMFPLRVSFFRIRYDATPFQNVRRLVNVKRLKLRLLTLYVGQCAFHYGVPDATFALFISSH